MTDYNKRLEKSRPMPMQLQNAFPSFNDLVSDGSTSPKSPTFAKRFIESPSSPLSIHESTGFAREIVFINPPADINDYYDFGGILGEGGFGVVSKITRCLTFKEFAGKAIEKSSFKDKEIEDNFRTVFGFLLNNEHQNLLYLQRIFEDINNYYVVMQMYDCTLVKLVGKSKSMPSQVPAAKYTSVSGSSRNAGPETSQSATSYGTSLSTSPSESPYALSPERIQNLTRQLANGVGFLHQNRIIHRDIKPDNIMFEQKPPSNSDPDFGGAPLNLRLVDMDMCTFLPEESDTLKLRTIAGTAGYLAPEIFLNGTYSKGSDIFSIGATIYYMICAYIPCPLISLSSGRLTKELCDEMTRWVQETMDLLNSLDVEGGGREDFARMPGVAIECLKRCLEIDPESRYGSIDEILNSEWLFRRRTQAGTAGGKKNRSSNAKMKTLNSLSSAQKAPDSP